jgi:hypothetical protein
MTRTGAGVVATRKERDRELDAYKESKTQWQRERRKKDSGRIGKNGDWESEDVSDVKKSIFS